MNDRGDLPGFGDEETWPAYRRAHNDPRLAEPGPDDEIDQAQYMMEEIRKEIERAERAILLSDLKDFRLAMLNVHDISWSLFQ